MKDRTTIYVDRALIALARARGIKNLSEWVTERLQEAVGHPSEEALQRAALEHAQLAEELTRQAAGKTAEKKNLELMARAFAPRLGQRIDKPAHLEWIVARRTGFGFGDRDPEELLALIYDCLRDQREVA